MKVLVIGATDRAGTDVVKALLLRGTGVRAFTRRQPKPSAFHPGSWASLLHWCLTAICAA
jgi:uncharacterized protein YbjT (DUF2867 family)